MKRYIVPLVITYFASGCVAYSWEHLPRQTAALLADTPLDTEVAIACFDNKQIAKVGLSKTSDGWQPTENDHAVFEIGSVTKLYTAYIATQLIIANQIQLDQTIGQYIDALDANVAAPHLADITFKALLTHTSGLAFLPSDLTDMPVINSNPFQGYTESRLLSYLRHHPTLAAQNAAYRYSNLGYAVLGLALEGASGQSYAELLNDHVISPYQLQRTRLQRNDLQPQLIQGQNLDGSAADYWDFNAFQSSGGVYSSLNDVVDFIQRQLDPANPAAKLMQQAYQPAAGLGWAIQRRGSATWLEQTGATGGFTTAVLVQPDKPSAAVVLSNLSGLHPYAHRIADLAEWALNTQCP